MKPDELEAHVETILKSRPQRRADEQRPRLSAPLTPYNGWTIERQREVYTQARRTADRSCVRDSDDLMQEIAMSVLMEGPPERIKSSLRAYTRKVGWRKRSHAIAEERELRGAKIAVDPADAAEEELRRRVGHAHMSDRLKDALRTLKRVHVGARDAPLAQNLISAAAALLGARTGDALKPVAEAVKVLMDVHGKALARTARQRRKRGSKYAAIVECYGGEDFMGTGTPATERDLALLALACGWISGYGTSNPKDEIRRVEQNVYKYLSRAGANRWRTTAKRQRTISTKGKRRAPRSAPRSPDRREPNEARQPRATSSSAARVGTVARPAVGRAASGEQ